MGDHSHYLHDIATSRQDIMREIDHHPHPTPAMDHVTLIECAL